MRKGLQENVHFYYSVNPLCLLLTLWRTRNDWNDSSTCPSGVPSRLVTTSVSHGPVGPGSFEPLVLSGFLRGRVWATCGDGCRGLSVSSCLRRQVLCLSSACRVAMSSASFRWRFTSYLLILVCSVEMVSRSMCSILLLYGDK